MAALPVYVARRRMMKRVPQATVVVVNPTHFAVAIQYNSEAGGAPLVVAKGRGYIAQDATVMDLLLGLYRTNAWSGLKEPQPISGLAGADVAAAAIEGLLSVRAPRYA